MLPTLELGQDIIVFNWRYLFTQPKIGDLVVIRHNKLEIVKRIQQVFKQGYFVIGDNLKESTDSRSFGSVSKQEIVGKVVHVR